MGAAQASGVIFDIKKRAAEEDAKKHGAELDHAELDRLRAQVKDDYEERMDMRWAASRGWVDAIIAPHTTRDVLITTLGLGKRPPAQGRYKTGVMQT